MHAVFAALITLLAVTLGYEPAPQAPEITTEVYSIAESRYRHVGPESKFQSTPSTTVTLLLSGKDLVGVTHWYGVTVDKAVDDLGNDLVSDEIAQEAGGSDPSAIDREHMWFFEDSVPKDRLKLDVQLGVTPRAATELKTVAGSVMLRQATLETVTVRNLMKGAPRTVENAVLKKAGITLRIKSTSDSEIELEMRGKVEDINDFEVLNAKGDDLSQGSSGFSSSDERQLTIYVDDPAADARLRFQVVTDSEDVRLPFELSGIKLP